MRGPPMWTHLFLKTSQTNDLPLEEYAWFSKRHVSLEGVHKLLNFVMCLKGPSVYSSRRRRSQDPVSETRLRL